jgi:hypothetical protein
MQIAAPCACLASTMTATVAMPSFDAEQENVMGEQTPQLLRLARGAQYQVLAAPGTVLLVRRGHVVLREPLAWLAETCVRVEHRLTSEAAHAVTTAGRMELVALDAAEVVLIPAQPP